MPPPYVQTFTGDGGGIAAINAALAQATEENFTAPLMVSKTVDNGDGTFTYTLDVYPRDKL